MPVEYAALSFAIAPESKGLIQLFPAEPFRSRDGRPTTAENWQIDAEIAARVIERAALRKTPFVIDYEHQTLHAEKNGKEAPASGWLSGAALTWREGHGLFGTDVAWTEKAAGYIDRKEYKFISPVFSYDKKTGEVLQLEMVALTNNPGIDGMESVDALATQFFNRSDSGHTQKDHDMKAIALLLGLSADASEADISAAVTALKAKTTTLETENVALKTETAALKTQAPDPARFVPVETVTALQTQIATLTTRLNDTELEDVIAVALSSGKLIPAMEGWARDLGKKDLAALKTYIEKNPAIAALNSNQTGGKAPAENGDVLSADAMKITAMMGNDPVAILKTMKGA